MTKFVTKTIEDSIASKTVTSEGCWELNTKPRPDGYASFKGRCAHKQYFEYFIGPVPNGLDLDHLCRNRRCCNPHHLEPVTRRENLLRGKTIASKNALKTVCVKGHALTDDNIYRRKDRVCRACRKCIKIATEKYKRRMKNV